MYILQAQVALLLDGMSVFDRSIKVSMARGGAGPGVVRSNDPDRVQRTIHVGGLPMEDLSESVLAEFFQHVGEVSIPQMTCPSLSSGPRFVPGGSQNYMPAGVAACWPGELPVHSLLGPLCWQMRTPVLAELSQRWAWWAALPSLAGSHFAGIFG